MPRQARLDAPGTLHHVMVRGIEQRKIVRDDKDREAFVRRLGETAQQTGTSVYAWALLDNHAHLLVRSGAGLLSGFMRRARAATSRDGRSSRGHGAAPWPRHAERSYGPWWRSTASPWPRSPDGWGPRRQACGGS